LLCSGKNERKFIRFWDEYTKGPDDLDVDAVASYLYKKEPKRKIQFVDGPKMKPIDLILSIKYDFYNSTKHHNSREVKV